MDKRCGVSFSCYSSCIAKMLQEKGIELDEIELLKSKYLLKLNCNLESDGIYSDIEHMVNDVLIQDKVEVNDIYINNFQQLEHIFRLHGGVVLNLDCNQLEYSHIFKNVKSKQSRHYVYIEDIFRDNIKILDFYIPEIPVTTFEGCIKMNFAKEKYQIKVLDTSTFTYNHTNENNLICKMIEEYFESIGNGVFEKCKRNIIDAQKMYSKNGQVLYEMSTALSVSGTIASRKIFYYLIKNNLYIPERIKNMVRDFALKYNCLRLLFLKTYIRPSVENLGNINLLLSDIKKKEMEIYNCIYSVLNVL